jgi:hypothetical protein
MRIEMWCGSSPSPAPGIGCNAERREAFLELVTPFLASVN